MARVRLPDGVAYELEPLPFNKTRNCTGFANGVELGGGVVVVVVGLALEPIADHSSEALIVGGIQLAELPCYECPRLACICQS